MTVLDASAVLAYLQDEPGSSTVAEAFVASSVCGAANWSKALHRDVAAADQWTESGQADSRRGGSRGHCGGYGSPGGRRW